MKYTTLHPIATAPTDGSLVRLFGPKGTVMGRYINCQWQAAPRAYRITPQPTHWVPADTKPTRRVRPAQEAA